MIHILDRQTERILDVLVNQSDSKIYWDTKMTESLENNVLIFEFSMLADSPAAKHIVTKNKLTAQDQDGFHRLFVIDTVEMSHDANGKTLFVSALGDHIELANDEPIPRKRCLARRLKRQFSSFWQTLDTSPVKSTFPEVGL